MGIDHGINEDDDVYIAPEKNRIPRVSYDKDKSNGDLSSLDIYKQYLNDDDEVDDNEAMPFDSEQNHVKLDRYIN